MWTKPIQSGGVVGGNNYPALPGNTWFEGSAYSQRYGNPIIVDGMLIYNPPIGWSGVAGGSGTLTQSTDQQHALTCKQDRHSGLTRTWVQYRFAYVYDAEDPNQHGVWPPVLIRSNRQQWSLRKLPRQLVRLRCLHWDIDFQRNQCSRWHSHDGSIRRISVAILRKLRPNHYDSHSVQFLQVQ